MLRRVIYIKRLALGPAAVFFFGSPQQSFGRPPVKLNCREERKQVVNFFELLMRVSSAPTIFDAVARD